MRIEIVGNFSNNLNQPILNNDHPGLIAAGASKAKEEESALRLHHY